MNIFNHIINSNFRLTIFVIVALFLLYFPSLNIIPFGDDRVEVFNNWIIYANNNPFLYWIPWHDLYKTWSLSYSLLLIFYNVFGENYYLYRSTNLLLHAINCFIFLKILDQISFSRSLKLFSLLVFAFHPFVVESVLWIFQFKTILSTTFFLLCCYYFIDFYIIRNYSSYFLSLFTFFLSIQSKTTYVFVPFSLIYFLRKFKLNKPIKHSIPFIVICIFSIVMTVQGVGSRKT